MKGIILDLDGARRDIWDLLMDQHRKNLLPASIWGIKLRNYVRWHGIDQSLRAFGKQINIFVDDKCYDVPAAVGSMVKQYADLGESSPKMITVSGDLDDKSIEAAVQNRGSISIIVTAYLSSWSKAYSENRYGMSPAEFVVDTLTRVEDLEAQGITCPAWLLGEIDWSDYFDLIENFCLVATGIRSRGLDPGDHIDPRSPKEAFHRGATHVVVGSEFYNSLHPLTTLNNIAVECEQFITAIA